MYIEFSVISLWILFAQRSHNTPRRYAKTTVPAEKNFSYFHLRSDAKTPRKSTRNPEVRFKSPKTGQNGRFLHPRKRPKRGCEKSKLLVYYPGSWLHGSYLFKRHVISSRDLSGQIATCSFPKKSRPYLGHILAMKYLKHPPPPWALCETKHLDSFYFLAQYLSAVVSASVSHA